MCRRDWVKMNNQLKHVDELPLQLQTGKLISLDKQKWSGNLVFFPTFLIFFLSKFEVFFHLCVFWGVLLLIFPLQQDPAVTALVIISPCIWCTYRLPPSLRPDHYLHSRLARFSWFSCFIVCVFLRIYLPRVPVMQCYCSCAISKLLKFLLFLHPAPFLCAALFVKAAHRKTQVAMWECRRKKRTNHISHFWLWAILSTGSCGYDPNESCEPVIGAGPV